MSARMSAFFLIVFYGLFSGSIFAASPEQKKRAEEIEQLIESWNIEEAVKALHAWQIVSPEDEAVVFYQGRIAFEQGHYAQAVEYYQRAHLTDSAGSYLRLAKETLSVVRDDDSKESEHFIVYFPKGKDQILAPYALETLEAARSAFEKDLGFAPPEKIRIEIVNNAKELAKVSTLTLEQIRTTGTIAICKFNKLMVTSPKALPRGYDWLDTVTHEYVHLVVSRKSQNTVPIWMHEGLAKYLESRWRGPAGAAMTPSTLALLGDRVRRKKLIPFEKMHPSMAMLPTAEDAATAFAEVFFAIDLIHQVAGPSAFQNLLVLMASGMTDQHAIEKIMREPWATFQTQWRAHMEKQPFPKEFIPRSSDEKRELVDSATNPKKTSEHRRDITFGDFAEMTETEARQDAHLGELFRERHRTRAASESYGRAYGKVGSKYESLSNKYALALIEIDHLDLAQTVLESSLKNHPGSAQTQMQLGRISLRKKAYPEAVKWYQGAIAVNPFDVEVHVGLYSAASQLKNAAVVDRSKQAIGVLLNIPADKVENAVATIKKVILSEGQLK